VFCAFLLSQAGISAAAPEFSPNAKLLPEYVPQALLETIELARTRGDRIWKGYGSERFGFLLVEPGQETLLCDPRLPDGFKRVADEPLLRCEQAIGPSSWRQTSFLAAMPVFGPPSLIVMGTPEATGRTMGEWKMTILHEHFHQWQSNQKDYYKRVEAMDLSGGDQTGMWMVNYPFPYSSAAVAALHSKAAFALRKAILAKKGRELTAANILYLQTRRDLQASVSEKDWRYFEFQLWQEGVARWTEIEIASRSRNAEVRASALAARKKTLDDLAAPDLKGDGRVAVYAFGAGEAMLLERVAPNWRQCYLQNLSLGPRFEKQC